MTKKHVHNYEWRITRVKGSPIAFVGRVWAPDADEAVKRAIKEFEIADPEHQKLLIAQRVQ